MTKEMCFGTIPSISRLDSPSRLHNMIYLFSLFICLRAILCERKREMSHNISSNNKSPITHFCPYYRVNNILTIYTHLCGKVLKKVVFYYTIYILFPLQSYFSAWQLFRLSANRDFTQR